MEDRPQTVTAVKSTCYLKQSSSRRSTIELFIHLIIRFKKSLSHVYVYQTLEKPVFRIFFNPSLHKSKLVF